MLLSDFWYALNSMHDTFFHLLACVRSHRLVNVAFLQPFIPPTPELLLPRCSLALNSSRLAQSHYADMTVPSRPGHLRAAAAVCPRTTRLAPSLGCPLAISLAPSEPTRLCHSRAVKVVSFVASHHDRPSLSSKFVEHKASSFNSFQPGVP